MNKTPERQHHKRAVTGVESLANLREIVWLLEEVRQKSAELKSLIDFYLSAGGTETTTPQETASLRETLLSISQTALLCDLGQCQRSLIDLLFTKMRRGESRG